jgi:hypothetical protein
VTSSDVGDIALWNALGFPEPRDPWESIREAIGDLSEDEQRGTASAAPALNSDYADADSVSAVACAALDRVGKSKESVVFGPPDLLSSAACFNWALCAGSLGFGAQSWPESLFDWVSVQERSVYPWRSEGNKPWKTVSLCAVQRRCAVALCRLPDHILAELDQLTAAHLGRVSLLSRQDWETPKIAAPLERQVAEELMLLAARVAGLTPCDESTAGAVGLAMRGKPDLPPNFSHWWLEVPTGRTNKKGEPVRVNCETYPSAPPYFTRCPRRHRSHDPERGHAVVYVTGVFARHLEVMRLALLAD